MRGGSIYANVVCNLRTNNLSVHSVVLPFRYPYFLPNLLSGLLCLVIFSVCLTRLPETRSFRARDDEDEVFGPQVALDSEDGALEFHVESEADDAADFQQLFPARIAVVDVEKSFIFSGEIPFLDADTKYICIISYQYNDLQTQKSK